MHPIDEQTVLVTGATSGLGRALVQRLARAGASVVAHGRDASRLARTREEIRAATGHVVDTIQADLADLAQVHRMAEEVLERCPRLHALVNNAGVGFGPPGAGREVSAQGIELRFAVNHLAGYLLARRLAERLAECAPARIVQVASVGQLALDRADPFTEHNYDGVTAYRRSKLAQVMISFEFAADLAGTGVSVNAVHPAVLMDTAMVRESGYSPISTLQEGLDAVWRLLTDPELDEVSGRYFHGTKDGQPDPQANDPAARAWLRQLSDSLMAR
jgi:NAD(P)-dependent dehydrogenase (short-subunit alcohol dehydrogenase family)